MLGSPEGSAEAVDPVVKASPTRPSASEVDRHDACHLLCRSWGLVCMKTEGKDDRRNLNSDVSSGFSIVSIDHGSQEEKVIRVIVNDSMSGCTLNREVAIAARREDSTTSQGGGVYSKAKRAADMMVIDTKWLNVNKGDESAPNYRASWSVEKSPATSAATPPLGSLKAILSLCLSRQGQSKPCRVMAIDVKRAYFYAPATMTIHMEIPKEGWEAGDDVNVA